MPWKTQALFIHLIHLPVTHPSIHLLIYTLRTHTHLVCPLLLGYLPTCPSTNSIYFPTNWNALSTQPHIHLPIH